MEASRTVVKNCLIAGIVILGLFRALDVGADAAKDQLEAGISRVLETLESLEYKKAPLPERRVAIRRIVNAILEWDELAKRSLGRYWQERTPAEQQEFVRLLADVLDRGYLSKMGLYSGEKIAHLGERIEGNQAVVRTKIIATDGNGRSMTSTSRA